MFKTPPLISVIMPVYNSVAFLSEAIESIIKQTYKKFEFIIADDGSNDGSADLIHQYARVSSFIRPFFFSHRGTPRTLNAAINQARGAFIAYADSDDISLPERLTAQIQWLNVKSIDICGSQAEVFGTKSDMMGWQEGVNWLPESHEAVRREIFFRVALWRGAVMMKAEICKENPFNESIQFTDTEWPMRMALKYTLGNVPSVLVKIRRHNDNITDIRKEDFYKELTKYRFKYFYSLFPHTPLADYMAFCRLADRVPMQSLWELERAGQWLAHLASYPDEQLRQRMSQRWKEACERSVELGEECEIIFRHYQAQIEDNTG